MTEDERRALLKHLPIVARILVHTSRAAVGMGFGATLVLFVYIAAKLSGHPIPDTGLGNAAFCVAMLSVSVWVLCGLIAILADRMRGL